MALVWDAGQLVGVYSLADAEYYELLVTLGLSRLLGVATNVTEELVGERRRRAGKNRDREFARAPDAVGLLAGHLDGRRVQKVTWIGSHRSGRGVAADIEVSFTGGAPSYYQLKSVGGGMGTARNLGLEQVRARLPLELDGFVEGAFAAVVLALRELPGVTVTASTFAQLRVSRAAYEDKALAQYDSIAKLAYRPWKERLTEEIARVFNEAPRDARARFVLETLGLETDAAVYMLIHNAAGPRIMSSERLVEHLARSELKAERNVSGNSLAICADGVRLFRLNSTATNHQGLSDPCVRLFFAKGAEDLLTRYGG